MFREEATQTNRDYGAGAALRSAGSSGISLQTRSSKLADTKTTVDIKELDTSFYLEIILFLERPFESMNGECCSPLLCELGAFKVHFVLVVQAS